MSTDTDPAAAGGTNEGTVLRFFELMDDQRFDELDSVLASDLRFHLGSTTMTRDELVSMIRGFYGAFPDWRHHVDEVLSVGSRVVVRATDRATHRGDFQGVTATGKAVTMGQIAIYEVRDGQIIEAWEQADAAGLMAQITAS